MDGNEILLLGLGIQSPWQLVDQRLDVDKQPHELHLTVRSDRGQRYACPVCGAQCAAHDFQEKTWRHLNFFQHHCYIHASVPRVKCPEHGVKLVDVPWARKGSAFTLLFGEGVGLGEGVGPFGDRRPQIPEARRRDDAITDIAQPVCQGKTLIETAAGSVDRQDGEATAHIHQLNRPEGRVDRNRVVGCHGGARNSHVGAVLHDHVDGKDDDSLCKDEQNSPSQGHCCDSPFLTGIPSLLQSPAPRAASKAADSRHCPEIISSPRPQSHHPADAGSTSAWALLFRNG